MTSKPVSSVKEPYIIQFSDFADIDSFIRKRCGTYLVPIEDPILAKQMEKVMYESVTIACDVDDVIFCNTKTLKLLFDDNDPRVRGETRTICDTYYTLTTPNTIKHLLALRSKGVQIVFVTSRSSTEQKATEEQIKAFGFDKPTVWCTDRSSKGPFLKAHISHLSRGILVAIDDEQRNLKSYVGIDAYPEDQVMLLQFMTW
jgi:hypothetical protein